MNKLLFKEKKHDKQKKVKYKQTYVSDPNFRWNRYDKTFSNADFFSFE